MTALEFGSLMMRDYKGDVIVFDLETKQTFDDVGGRNYGDLGISVLGYYSYKYDEYACLLEPELSEFENILIDASLIVGYNINKFDLPVLQPYLSLNIASVPTLDLLEDINNKLGFRVGLDSVAQATLGVGKTGHGLDAIEYFKRKQWDKLKSYCLNDVKITRMVYDHGVNNGEIFFMSRDGMNKKNIKVAWQGWQAKPQQDDDSMQQYRLIF